MKTSVTKTMYGSVALYRKYCSECEQWAIIQDGEYACCGRKVEKPDIYKVKRMSQSENHRSYIPTKLKRQILEQQSHRCAYCENTLHFKNLREIHFDHFIPWCWDGNNSKGNLYATCSICNLLKSDKIFYDFISAREYVLEKKKLREGEKEEE